jgi:hypothetical protein
MAYKIKHTEQLEALRKLQPMGWNNMDPADVNCFDIRLRAWKDAMRAMIQFMVEDSTSPTMPIGDYDNIHEEACILDTSF